MKYLFGIISLLAIILLMAYLSQRPTKVLQPAQIGKQTPKQEFASQLIGVWYRRGRLDTELTFEPDGKGVQVKFIDDTGEIVMQHFYPHWEIKVGYDILNKENFQYVKIEGYSSVLIEKYGYDQLIEPSPEYTSVSSDGLLEVVDHYSEKINTVLYKENK